MYDATFVAATMGIAKILAWFDGAIVDGIVNGAGYVTKFIAVVSSKFDSIVVDGLVNFTAFTAGISGRFLRTVQTGKVQTYIIFAIV
ncbi:MAG TPA: NADH-quinone oxidoreductase subunit L, partial [Bacteroidetes bacterium]|nr:NADH-quinone oxidoreductase subunit L [Bacteroidota bacterium]